VKKLTLPDFKIFLEVNMLDCFFTYMKVIDYFIN